MVAAILLLLGQTAPVEILEFGGKSCLACLQQEPILRQIEQAGVKVVRADFETEKAAVAAWRVEAMPTMIVHVGGRELKRFVGLTQYAQLMEAITQATPPTPIPRATLPVDSGLSNIPLGNEVAPTYPQWLYTGYDYYLEQQRLLIEWYRQAAIQFAEWQRQVLAWWFATAPYVQPVVPVQPAQVPLTVPAAPAPARLTVPLTVKERAISSHVRVKVSFGNGDKLQRGSGIIVQSTDKFCAVITNKHVVDSGQRTITIDDGTGWFLGAQCSEFWPKDSRAPDDLALILCQKPAASITPICELGYTPVEPLWVVGGPRGDIPRVRPARLVGRFNETNGASSMELSVGFIKGESGGGVYDSKGILVGVIYGSDMHNSVGYAVDLTRSRWVSESVRKNSQKNLSTLAKYVDN